jgi:phosphoglycolate phosphatase-like HAD superfamily hydrolase
VRLIVFDCDGTLVDSQATIVACMQTAFTSDRRAPDSPGCTSCYRRPTPAAGLDPGQSAERDLGE